MASEIRSTRMVEWGGYKIRATVIDTMCGETITALSCDELTREWDVFPLNTAASGLLNNREVRVVWESYLNGIIQAGVALGDAYDQGDLMAFALDFEPSALGNAVYTAETMAYDD